MKNAKFRGLSIQTKKWLYGDVKHYKKKVYIVPFNSTETFEEIQQRYEVDKDTVCQYTGRKDINGRELYEEDEISDEYDEYTIELSDRCGYIASARSGNMGYKRKLYSKHYQFEGTPWTDENDNLWSDKK